MQRKWAAFPARQDRALRVPEDTWKRLLGPPPIPRDATNRLQTEQSLSSGNFEDQLCKHLENSLNLSVGRRGSNATSPRVTGRPGPD